VRDQFSLLETLQQLDDRIRALVSEQNALPQQLQPYEASCAAAQEALAASQTAIEHIERQRRDFERELESDQTQLGRTQSRLREVKTNKEYSAVLVEIETRKQKIAVLEDQVLELMEAAEQRRQFLQEYEQRVQDAAQELEKQEDKMVQMSRTLEQQRATSDTERRQVVAQLDAELYTAYENLRMQRGDLVVVHLRDGTCGGCYLTVRPQLVSEIRRQETLVTCPHCRRILLWPA
jgi:predicted  nucleic acid-binding Zn-ribbon protein